MPPGETIATETRILIVDDDEKLCRLVTDYLSPMGYDVASAHDGIKGLEMLENGDFNAVILDVMMPKMDGFEMLKQLRKQSDIPVLMLTARGDETDRIVGLEMGADDYLPKTFSSRELLARLRAVTRRYHPVENKTGASKIPKNILKVAELQIHLDARTAFLAEKPLNLTPLEYDLLITLAKSQARVLSRDQLLDAVAGRNYDVFDRSVDVHISSLRRKLGEAPRNPRFIQTVRTVGYMFNDPGKIRTDT